MTQLGVRVRQGAAVLSWRRIVIVAGCLALFAAAAANLKRIPPVYEVRLGDRPVGSGRDLTVLGALLQQEAERQLYRTVALTANGQEWTVTLQELGFVANPKEMPDILRAARSHLPWYRQMPWSRPTLAVSMRTAWSEERLNAALAPIRAAVEGESKPATFAVLHQQPTITPEQNGLQVDVHSLLDSLKTLGDRTTVNLPLIERRPTVTKASLDAMRIRRVIAEWSTQYDPTIPRAENVERAARAFNGLVVKPGEVLSYNATVGPVDSANGWKPALVIVGGELVPGVGGGICQVATTFYGAALRANLEILERHPHQLALTYIAPSQDAAISADYEDLKIRNTSLGHLYIETESGGGRVTFRLYGDVPAGQDVKIESSVLGSKPFETRKVTDNTLAPGKQVVKIYGHQGMVSEAYRFVFMNGELVKKERLSQDAYLPTTQVVLVGPAQQPAPNATVSPALSPGPGTR